MKRLIAICIAMTMLQFTGSAQFGKLLDKGKEMISAEGSTSTADALKQALDIGVENAVKTLSAQNGYLESPYKILIPKDAQKVISKVKMVPGFKNVEETMISKMNEAAEIAAKKASPIFLDAIRGMSIQDGVSILMGDKNAATQYLESNTRKNLYSTFLPVIQSSLNEVNALSYWKDVIGAYNKIPFVKKMNPELDDHVNNKALDGMFSLIETKEEGIRSDKSLRSTQLLKDVFSKQDKN
jgi:hypothetical protein